LFSKFGIAVHTSDLAVRQSLFFKGVPMPINKTMQNIVDMPLYEQLLIDEEIKNTLSDYLDNKEYNQLSVELYCIHCKNNSTFNPLFGAQLDSRKSTIPSFAFFNEKIQFAVLHYKCARDTTHYYSFQLMIKDNNLIKIGQFPSKADIEIPEYNRFSKIIPEDKLSDLKRSAGLASHGIGAGSFVYLRRVFEYLLEEAHKKAVTENKIDDQLYLKSRVLERIDLLKEYLPVFMLENKQLYAILSKGVHELTEDECLASYSIIKGTIEIILEEILEKKEKEKREEKLRKEISNIHSKLKK
jgi:hypothetical protein